LTINVILGSFYSLDVVQDLIDNPSLEADFTDVAKGLPDLERIVSRIHAKSCKVKDFIKVLKVCKNVMYALASLTFLC
jgi:DNA mismatch repair protein MSH6